MLSRNEILNYINEMNMINEKEYEVTVLPVKMSVKEYLMFTGICNIYNMEEIDIDKLFPKGEYCSIKDSVVATDVFEVVFNFELEPLGDRPIPPQPDSLPLVLLTDHDVQSVDGVLVSAYALGMKPDMFIEFNNYKKLIRENINSIYIGYVELVQDLSEDEAAYSDICASIDELDYDSLKKEILGRNWDYSNIPDELKDKINNIWLELENCITRTISKMSQINPAAKPIYDEIMEDRYGVGLQDLSEDKAYEEILKRINALSNKMDTFLSKMEQLENKYAIRFLSGEPEKKISEENAKEQSFIDAETFNKALKMADEELGLAQMDDSVLRLAERIYNASHREEYLDENQRIAVINSIAGDLEKGGVEKYMDALNGILVDRESMDDECAIIKGIVEDLADYNYENKESVDVQNPEMTIYEIPEEPLNGIKNIGSGNLFTNWVISQDFDARIKNALSSIEYVFDEITRSDNNKIIVSDKNIIGLEVSGYVKMYDDGNGKNKISNFLIDVNNILKGSVHEMAVRECYDIVRAVEREKMKAKKSPQR